MISILFLGNCQINAMRGIFRGMFPKLPCTFRTITPYWGTFDEPEIRARLAEADIVISQAIENPAATFNVADVRASTKGHIVFMPYIYVDGISGLEIVASKGRSVVKGADLLIAQGRGQDAFRIMKDYVAGHIDLDNAGRLRASLDRLAAKEAAQCDIAISDYIAGTWADRPAQWGINHPTQHILFEMFRRLCLHLDLPFDPGFCADPIEMGRRALPMSTRSFSPIDVAALGLSYDCDPHWFGQTGKLIGLALKHHQRAQDTAAPAATSAAA